MSTIHSCSFLQQITQIDNDLKAKAASYNNLKNTLAAFDRKAT